MKPISFTISKVRLTKLQVSLMQSVIFTETLLSGGIGRKFSIPSITEPCTSSRFLAVFDFSGNAGKSRVISALAIWTAEMLHHRTCVPTRIYVGLRTLVELFYLPVDASLTTVECEFFIFLLDFLAYHLLVLLPLQKQTLHLPFCEKNSDIQNLVKNSRLYLFAPGHE